METFWYRLTQLSWKMAVKRVSMSGSVVTLAFTPVRSCLLLVNCTCASSFCVMQDRLLTIIEVCRRMQLGAGFSQKVFVKTLCKDVSCFDRLFTMWIVFIGALTVRSSLFRNAGKITGELSWYLVFSDAQHC